MHALLITFQSATPLDELAEPFAAYAESLSKMPGFIAKTWLRDGATLGGFHLFTDGEAAEAYLNGELVAGLTANPAFSTFRIEHYAVLEELSRLTGTPQLVGAGR